MRRNAFLLILSLLLAGCASRHETPACRGEVFDLNPAGAPR